MDNDPCADNALWSVLNSTVPDLTLAGVLAGFLIAVVAALVVQWYDRVSPRMIALFASGVPTLTLSSYLFTISSGAKPPTQRKVVSEIIEQPGGVPKFHIESPPSNPHADPNDIITYCNQVWSQWLPAFAALLIGGSVLLCGLGWALVIYGDHLADRLKEKNLPTGAIEDYRRYFIFLSALLSLAATIGMTGLLIVANVAYLTGTADTTLIFFEFPHGVNWYAMYFVFLVGVYAIVASTYVVISRTTSFAWGERASGVHTESSARRGALGNKRARRAAREIGIVLVLMSGALFAGYLTKGVLGDRKFSGDAISYVEVVTATYAIIRLACCGILQMRQNSRSKREGHATTKGFAESDATIPFGPSTETPEDAIQLNYSSGMLRATTYHVVFFALLGAIFTVVVTNGYLWKTLGSWQTGLALFIGGLYPASILLGLSYSVPADPSVQLPNWKTLPVLRFLR